MRELLLLLNVLSTRQIIEEAEAEKDLFYSQRKKKVEATMATNRCGSTPRGASRSISDLPWTDALTGFKQSFKSNLWVSPRYVHKNLPLSLRETQKLASDVEGANVWDKVWFPPTPGA